MSRYRPAEKPGSQFITPAGELRLKQELDQLWRVERPRVTQAVSEAAAQGDRSENAEYIYGKRRLREIDRRIRFITKRLDGAEVVRAGEVATDVVRFGASVTLVDENGKTSSYRIVGPDEANPAEGRISFQSPLGQSLMKRKVGDTVLVRRPAGELEVEITVIEYA